MTLDQHNPDQLTEQDAKELAVLSCYHELNDLQQDVEKCESNKAFLIDNLYFGLAPQTQKQEELILAALNDVEAHSPVPIFSLPKSVIKQALSSELGELETFESHTQFSALFQQLESKSITNRAYLIQVLALADQDTTAVPQQYVERYQQFEKLLSPLLVTDASDRQIIESRFADLDLSAHPEPQVFIQNEVLNNDQISEVTKDRVKEAFDLPTFEVDSGTDIAEGLNQQIRNPKTGELEYRFDETRKLEFRKGIKAFNQSETGNKMITAELADGRTRDFDVTGWPASDLTALSDYLMFWRISEEAGLSNYLETIFYVDMALIDDFDPMKARQSRQTIEALLGYNHGYDGQIMNESDGQFLIWMLQAFSPKGDAAQGDYDIEATNQNLVELGIKDSSGRINFETLKSAGSYLRGLYLSGQPGFLALKKYLQRPDSHHA